MDRKPLLNKSSSEISISVYPIIPNSPPFFVLPVHSTLMSITDSCIREHWQQEWSRRDFRTYKFNIGPTKTASRPIRCEEVTLCRLRLGITCLTHINPWRAKDYPAICDYCDEELTIRHILLECLLYVRHRRDIVSYFNGMNRRLTLYGLLEDKEETTELLLEYLRNTGLIVKL